MNAVSMLMFSTVYDMLYLHNKNVLYLFRVKRCIWNQIGEKNNLSCTESRRNACNKTHTASLKYNGHRLRGRGTIS